jgi:hypothetical protein
MAHLWTRKDGDWGARRLDGARFDLAADSIRPAGDCSQAAPGGQTALLIRVDTGGSKVWALIAPADCDIRVNSRAASAGIRVLADRDEIRINGVAQYFSTETLAAVEAFPGTGRAVFCGRCRQKIEAGTPAVCCPGCGIWYHQDESASLAESERLPCWTYTEKCAFCGHPTALETGFAWTPEEE